MKRDTSIMCLNSFNKDEKKGSVTKVLLSSSLTYMVSDRDVRDVAVNICHCRCCHHYSRRCDIYRCCIRRRRRRETSVLKHAIKRRRDLLKPRRMPVAAALVAAAVAAAGASLKEVIRSPTRHVRFAAARSRIKLKE